MKYILQRIQDVENVIRGRLGKIGAMCPAPCQTAAEAQEVIHRLENRIYDNGAKLSHALGMQLPGEVFADDDPAVHLKNLLLNGETEEFEDEWQRQYEDNTEHINEIQLKIKEYETILNSQCEGENLQVVEEEIARLQESKKKLEETHASLKTALDVLTEASSEIQKSFSPQLNHKMSYILSRLTGGRYKDLRADQSLSLQTLCPETGEVTPALLLSGGTIDQAYLALRLSTAGIAADDGEQLPLIMDEVFAQYDDQRIKLAFECFKDMYADGQLLLFTCKSREADITGEVYGSEINRIELSV